MKATWKGIGKKHLYVLWGITLSLGAAVLIWQAALHHQPAVVVPESVSRSLLFTPYLPQTLPKGYLLDKTSIVSKEGALFFALTAESSSMTFSEQATPKSYDMNTFYDMAISSPRRLTVRAGAAVFGDSTDRKGTVISYTTTDNTWVIITLAGDKLSSSDAAKLINSLVASKN